MGMVGFVWIVVLAESFLAILVDMLLFDSEPQELDDCASGTYLKFR